MQNKNENKKKKKKKNKIAKIYLVKVGKVFGSLWNSFFFKKKNIENKNNRVDLVVHY